MLCSAFFYHKLGPTVKDMISLKKNGLNIKLIYNERGQIHLCGRSIPECAVVIHPSTLTWHRWKTCGVGGVLQQQVILRLRKHHTGVRHSTLPDWDANSQLLFLG